jgi:hypothetical protein
VTCVAGNGRRKCGAIDQSLLFNNELGYQKFNCVHSWRFRFVSWLVLRKISNEDKRLSTHVLVILPTALITKNQAPWHWKLTDLFFKFRNASKHELTQSVALPDGRTPVVYYRADSNGYEATYSSNSAPAYQAPSAPVYRVSQPLLPVLSSAYVPPRAPTYGFVAAPSYRYLNGTERNGNLRLSSYKCY